MLYEGICRSEQHQQSREQQQGAIPAVAEEMPSSGPLYLLDHGRPICPGRMRFCPHYGFNGACGAATNRHCVVISFTFRHRIVAQLR